MMFWRVTKKTRHAEVMQRLDSVEQMLWKLLKTEGLIMKEMDDLIAVVARNTEVASSAVAMMNNLAAQLSAAGVDPAKLAELTVAIGSSADALAAAVTANTPAG